MTKCIYEAPATVSANTCYMAFFYMKKNNDKVFLKFKISTAQQNEMKL